MLKQKLQNIIYWTNCTLKGKFTEIDISDLTSEKNRNKSFIKRFLKRNLANIGMIQYMNNVLADKVHKQRMPCTQ